MGANEKNLINEILLEEALQFAIKKEEYEKAIKYAIKGIEDSKGQWNRNGHKCRGGFGVQQGSG